MENNKLTQNNQGSSEVSQLELLEAQVKRFCDKCSLIKQKLLIEKNEELANSDALRQEFAVGG